MEYTAIWEPAEPGVRRMVLEPGTALMMMVVEFEAGAHGYEHAHPHEQMTYCLEGHFVFTVDGCEHPLRAGENLAIPSNVLHSTVALEKGRLLDCFTPLRDDLLHL